MCIHLFLRQRPSFFETSLFVILFLCLLTLSAPTAAQTNDTPNVMPESAQINPAELLAQMAQASNTLNYESALILFRPGQEPVPYLWKHGVVSNSDSSTVAVELLSELNGPNAKIVRFDNQVSYFNPDMPAHTLQQSHIHGPFAHNLIRDPAQIKTAYEVILVGKSRVAGNDAWQLRVVSRDSSRYNYTLWIDTESLLPLKLNTVNLKGELIEQVQATNLVITDSPNASFTQLMNSDMPDIMHINPPKAFELNWNISRLPIGMVKVKRDIHRLSITGDVVEYALLSDGMVDVSVYLQKAVVAQAEDVLFVKDATTFLSRVNDGLQVSIVGKLPPATAQRIMQMIESVPAQNVSATSATESKRDPNTP
mgnify:FL=1